MKFSNLTALVLEYLHASFDWSQGIATPVEEPLVQSLRQNEERLSQIVRSGFDAAVAAQDKAAVSRFAKLFYPLGIEQEGVERYLSFIRSSLAETCSATFLGTPSSYRFSTNF